MTDTDLEIIVFVLLAVAIGVYVCVSSSIKRKKAAENAAVLKKLGATAVWFPPATKGAQGKEDMGYAPYDLYDLENLIRRVLLEQDTEQRMNT